MEAYLAIKISNKTTVIKSVIKTIIKMNIYNYFNILINFPK